MRAAEETIGTRQPLVFGLKIVSILAGSFMSVLAISLTSPSAASLPDLLISEYVEGSSNNKALEIFNGTGLPVPLDAYAVSLYANGATTASNHVELATLQEFLGAGEVMVLKHSGFTDYSGEAYDATVANFNGDDAIALLKGGVPIDVIGTIGVREDLYGDITLRRRPDAAGPRVAFDPGEWVVHPTDTFDGLGHHAFAIGEKPEPSEYPTALSVESVGVGSLRLRWTDSSGEHLPENYLILISTGGDSDHDLPINGEAVSLDTDIADGTGAVVAAIGVESLTLTGLAVDATYTFAFIPFANAGANTRYKTVPSPPVVSGRSTFHFLEEDFETESTWSLVAFAEGTAWRFEDGLARAEPIAAGTPVDHWLVSPAVDGAAGGTAAVFFRARFQSDNPALPPQALDVLVSTDFDGRPEAANVGAANWHSLFPVLPIVSGNDFEPAGMAPLPMASGPVYLAFRYASAPPGRERWEIDDVVISTDLSIAPVLSLAVDSATIAAGGPPAMATVTLPAPAAAPVRISITADSQGLLVDPPSAVVRAGETEESFLIMVAPGVFLEETMPVALRAIGSGYRSAGTQLDIEPTDPGRIMLAIVPSELTAGAGVQAAEGTVTLSREPREYPWTVTLENPRPDLISLPESIVFESLADGLSRTFTIETIPAGKPDPETEIVIRATVKEYEDAAFSIVFRSPVPPPIVSLRLEPTEVEEGSVITAEVIMAPPLSTATTLELQGNSDFRVSAPQVLPVGADTATFTLAVVRGDGFEPTEEHVLRVQLPGYPTAETSFRILNLDPRGTWLEPQAGERRVAGRELHLRAYVADPLGSLEAVDFFIDGEIVGTASGPPYEIRRPTKDDPREMLASFRVIDPVLGNWTSEILRFSTVHSPLRSDSHFIRQIWKDLTGLPISPESAAAYRLLIDDGLSRAEVVLRMLEEPAVRPILDAVMVTVLCLDRFPTAQELFLEGLLLSGGAPLFPNSGEEWIGLPPMVEIIRMGESESPLPELSRFFGGVSGLADVLLHAHPEAAMRFGAAVETLNTSAFFQPVWNSRHGRDPTAQQIVQAHNRMLLYEEQADRVVGDIPGPAFARARLIEGLVKKETFFAGTDIIHAPPNDRLAEMARFGLVGAVLGGAETDLGASAARGDAASLAAYVEELIAHPRSWYRFGDIWLDADVSTSVPSVYESAWYGQFYYTEDSWPWVKHEHHGWIWVGAAVPYEHGFWWWEKPGGWFWTSAEHYPWCFEARSGSWLYFMNGISETRRFLSFDNEEGRIVSP